MMTHHRSGHSHIIISLAFSLAIFAGFAGVARCFLQSPQSQSDRYVKMSIAARANDIDLALNAAIEAARLNPISRNAWANLSLVLQQSGDDIAARQAMQIAQRLETNPGQFSPAYAMPAELRLSFLAAGYGDL